MISKLRWVVLMLAATLPLGCTSRSEPKQGRKTSATQQMASSPSSVTHTQSDARTPLTSEPIAVLFLQALKTGVVNLDLVSPEFLRIVAEPGVLPSDIERGYDKDEALAWFTRFKGKEFSLPESRYQTGGVGYYAGSVQGTHEGYTLRLTQEQERWKVDWLQITQAVLTTKDVSDAPAVFTGWCLVQALPPMNDPETRMVASLLTPELRGRLGPPFPSDQGRGFNLRELRLSLQRLANANSYEVRGTNNALLASGTMPRDIPATKSQLVVHVTESPRQGLWLVSDISTK